MHRRHFLITTSGTLLAGLARAQPRPPILGFINDTGSNAGPQMIAMLRGLGRHGFISNQTVLLMYQQADRYEDAAAIAENLVKRGVAAIVTLNSPNVALAAREATKTIPIVFGCAGDPVKLGLVESIEKPGGNLTGVTYAAPATMEKRAQWLGRLASEGKGVGLLVNPASRANLQERADFAAAITPMGRAFAIYEASGEAEIDTAFERARNDGIGALAIADDSRLTRAREKIIAAALRAKIPTLHAAREEALSGGTISYGDMRAEQMMKLGELAGRVLKGENPAGIAVTRAEKFETVLNVKAAKAMGIEVSAEMRALAGETIE